MASNNRTGRFGSPSSSSGNSSLQSLDQNIKVPQRRFGKSVQRTIQEQKQAISSKKLQSELKSSKEFQDANKRVQQQQNLIKDLERRRNETFQERERLRNSGRASESNIQNSKLQAIEKSLEILKSSSPAASQYRAAVEQALIRGDKSTLKSLIERQGDFFVSPSKINSFISSSESSQRRQQRLESKGKVDPLKLTKEDLRRLEQVRAEKSKVSNTLIPGAIGQTITGEAIYPENPVNFTPTPQRRPQLAVTAAPTTKQQISQIIKEENPVTGLIDFGVKKGFDFASKFDVPGGITQGKTGRRTAELAEVALFVNPVTGPALDFAAGAGQFTPGGRKQAKRIGQSLQEDFSIPSEIGEVGVLALAGTGVLVSARPFTRQLESLSGLPKFETSFVSRQINTETDELGTQIIRSKTAAKTQRKGLLSDKQIISGAETEFKLFPRVDEGFDFVSGSRGAFRQERGVNLATGKRSFKKPKKFASISTGKLQARDDLNLLLTKTSSLNIAKPFERSFVVKSASETIVPRRFGRVSVEKTLDFGVSGDLSDQSSVLIGKSVRVKSSKPTKTKFSRSNQQFQLGITKKEISEPNMLNFQGKGTTKTRRSFPSLDSLTDLKTKQSVESAIRASEKTSSLKSQTASRLTGSAILGLNSKKMQSSKTQSKSDNSLTSAGSLPKQKTPQKTRQFQNLGLGVDQQYRQLTKLSQKSLTKQQTRQIPRSRQTQDLLLRQDLKQTQKNQATSSRNPKFTTGIPFLPPPILPRLKNKKTKLGPQRKKKKRDEFLFFVPTLGARITGRKRKFTRAELFKEASSLTGFESRDIPVLK